MKPQMTKTSQDNNLNYINISRLFYEYHTEKLKYRDENEKKAMNASSTVQLYGPNI